MGNSCTSGTPASPSSTMTPMPEPPCTFPLDQVYYRTTPRDPRPIYYAPSGLASKKSIPADTLVAALYCAAKIHKDGEALAVERPLPEDQIVEDAPWVKWSWQEYADNARLVASAMVANGVEKFDGVAVWGFNAPEWHFSFLGAMMAGAIPAGVYPTDSPDTVCFKTKHIGARFLIVQTQDHVTKMRNKLDSVPKLKKIIVYGDVTVLAEGISRKDGSTVSIEQWSDFIASGKVLPDGKTKQEISNELDGRAPVPEDCAVIVFTSGTTGLPKAVMISHDSLIYEARAVVEQHPTFARSAESTERVLSFLPLSHVAGLMVDVCAPIAVAAYSAAGANATTFFARPYDLKMGTIAKRLRFVKPTAFLAVPLVWEKIQMKLNETMQAADGVKGMLLWYARKVALERHRAYLLGGSHQEPAMYEFFNTRVLVKIKERLGLDQCKWCMTGAAPISRTTLEFYASLGITIHEVYGASECSGASVMTTDRALINGSIGYPLAGVEVCIFDPRRNLVPRCEDLFHPSENEQGEICFRGRNVMMGYMQSMNGDDDEKDVMKKNSETLTNDGWCRSGDKGCCDERGMMRVTGRFKELIKTSGGEIVAPVPIEDAIMTRANGILSKVVVIGDRRPFNVALCTLQQEGATGEMPGNGILAGDASRVSPDVTTTEQAVDDPGFLKRIEEAIEAVNNDPTVCLNRSHRVAKFTILPRDFCMANDEYTPTLKYKRTVIESNCAQVIDDMYFSVQSQAGSLFDNSNTVFYVRCKL